VTNSSVVPGKDVDSTTTDVQHPRPQVPGDGAAGGGERAQIGPAVRGEAGGDADRHRLRPRQQGRIGVGGEAGRAHPGDVGVRDVAHRRAPGVQLRDRVRGDVVAGDGQARVGGRAREGQPHVSQPHDQQIERHDRNSPQAAVDAPRRRTGKCGEGSAPVNAYRDLAQSPVRPAAPMAPQCSGE
jgi:hypothetical protein